MFYRYGRCGGSLRSGAGLGFRGSSPSWPYIGRGRGGLPRCGYHYNVTSTARPMQPPVSGRKTAGREYTSGTPQMTAEAELDYLKNQAQSIRTQLEHIDARIRDLEMEK